MRTAANRERYNVSFTVAIYSKNYGRMFQNDPIIHRALQGTLNGVIKSSVFCLSLSLSLSLPSRSEIY